MTVVGLLFESSLLTLLIDFYSKYSSVILILVHLYGGLNNQQMTYGGFEDVGVGGNSLLMTSGSG